MKINTPASSMTSRGGNGAESGDERSICKAYRKINPHNETRRIICNTAASIIIAETLNQKPA